MQTKTGPILIGLAYIALVVFIMLFCASQTDTFDEFAKYWGLFGTLIGVATGVIPAFFFKSQADQANEKAAKATQKAENESEKAQLFAGIAEPSAVDRVRSENARLFV